MRKHCISCGSEKLLRYPYYTRVHLPLHKNIARIVLPYLDYVIPKSAVRLKRVSSFKKKGSSAEDLIFSGRNILVCTACGHGALHPLPCETALLAYFRDKYWNKKSKLEYWLKGNQDDYKLDPRASSQWEFVRQYLSGREFSNMLEIGAGTAFMSQLIRTLFISVKPFVCEPSKQTESYYEARNITRIAEYFPFKTNLRFDYIHGSHWLGYMLDLEDTIVALRGLLSEKGLLFIEVPNCTDELWRLEKDHRPCINFFTMNSLVNVFERYNFECIEVGEFGNTYQEHYSGIKPNYGPKKDGCWVRALFRKKETKIEMFR